MKVLIYFAVHRRIEILKICLQGIARLKKYRSDIEISSLAVCSTREEAKLLKANGCHVVITENEPLGRKKNTGLREALKQEFDYLMELGSDDLIHNSLLDIYFPLMRDGVDFFGVRKVMFYDTQSAKVAQWENGFPIGAGRCIRRGVIEQVKAKVKIRITQHFANQYMLGIPGKIMVVDYATAHDLINSHMAEKVEQVEELKLWDDHKMSGMDNNSMLNICGSGFKITTVPSEYWQVLDIKSAENINTFDWFDSVNYDVLKHYPVEAEMIKRL
jgi:glycosyltransferase involved in cell wall biosynthesis